MLNVVAEKARATTAEQVEIELARAGDKDAIRSIIRANNQRLYRVARAILRNDHEAEDVVQETYARVFTRLDRFRGEAKLSTWMTRIAINEAVAHARASRRSIGTGDREMFNGTNVQYGLTSSENSGPHEETARARVRDLIQQAVDGLPEPFRVVYVFRDVEGLNVEETARCLSLKIETVRTRLFRARRLIREALKGRSISELSDVFPFAGTRCNRVAEQVLTRLFPERHRSTQHPLERTTRAQRSLSAHSR